MAAENLTAVVLAAIVSNYEKTMQKRRGCFRKQSLKIMHQLRRNAKKREALIFLYFRALGNRLFADRRFWVQETKHIGSFWEKTIALRKEDSLGLKTFDCPGERLTLCVKIYLLICCVKIHDFEKLYLLKKELRFAYGI